MKIEINVEQFEKLAGDFDRLMKTASEKRRRGLYDSEESFRNKANERAHQIIAAIRRKVKHAAHEERNGLPDHSDPQSREPIETRDDAGAARRGNTDAK